MLKKYKRQVFLFHCLCFHHTCECDIYMTNSRVLDILYRQEHIEANQFIVCKHNLHVAAEVWEGMKKNYNVEIRYPYPYPSWPPLGTGTVNFTRLSKYCYLETTPKKKYFYCQIECKDKTYMSQGSSILWDTEIGMLSIAYSLVPFWMFVETFEHSVQIT